MSMNPARRVGARLVAARLGTARCGPARRGRPTYHQTSAAVSRRTTERREP
jgi:hypothetical protein